MTAKEKAIELANAFERDTEEVFELSDVERGVAGDMVYDQLMAMAEWFKECLEKEKSAEGIDLEPSSSTIEEIIRGLFE